MLEKREKHWDVSERAAEDPPTTETLASKLVLLGLPWQSSS